MPRSPLLIAFLLAPALARGDPPPEILEIDVSIWIEEFFFGHHADQAACPVAIASRIDGEFAGWDGDTLFKLENGQLWRQLGRNVSHACKHSPEALVYSDHGACRLRISGMSDTIFVERVE